MTARVGQGFDVHPYSDDPARPCVLGGVRFDGERGLAGHSDSDVIAHAVCDALLGAAGLGDIGQHFPDTDPQWAGADSIALLAQVAQVVADAGWVAGNVDCTVVLDTPKLAPRRGEVEARLSEAAGCPVTVKGKRPEGLGALGRGEGVACWAVAIVERAELMAAPKPRKGNRNAAKRDRNAKAEEAKWKARRSGTAMSAAPGGKGKPKPKPAPRSGGGAAQTRMRSAPAERGPGRGATSKGLGGDQIEGRQAVRELLLGGRRVRELWLIDDDTGPLADIAELALELRIPVKQVSAGRLAGAARSEAPQGVLARCDPLEEVDLDVLLAARPGGAAPFLLAVDGVTDPGNLGALIRSAECNGVTGLILPRHRSVHVTPTVAKAAAGAIEHVPIAVVPGLPAALERAKKAGVWVIGLDGGGERRIDQIEAAAEPVILVLGAEGSGLSSLVHRRCDVVASIPLRGRLGSLNVAAAGAIATYEVARRRLDAAGSR